MDPLSSSQPSRATVFLLIAVAVLPYFLVLGSPPLWDANEPFYAERPKEVLEWPQGDFWAPTWNGKPYFAHPPLAVWITVPFYAWLGSNEFAARLPMALAAVLTVFAVLRLGTLAGGRRIGLLAALALAATPRFWLYGRQLAGDVYLTALLTWALALALPALQGARGRGSLRAANLLVGLGFLAKGPVILVLYGGILLGTWLLSRERVPLAGLRPLRGLALMLLLGTPWFVYMSIRFAELDYFGQYFGHYTFGRVSGHIGQRGWLFYPRILLGDAMPALAVLPFAAAIAWRAARRSPAARLPWIGMAWIVLFFSLSAGKRNVYMMPLYPLMAVAVAPLAAAVWDGASRAGVRLAGCAAAFGCWAGAVLLYLLRGNAPDLAPEIWWPIGMLLVVSVPLLIAGLRGAGRTLVVGSLAAVFLLYTAVALTFPALARFRPVPEMAARVLAEQDPARPEPVVIHAVSIHSMNYYLGRATRVSKDGADLLEKIGPASGAFVLIEAHDFDAPPLDAGARRRGLKNDGTGLVFEVLERRPLLTFRFERSILGRGPTTRDLLLLRARRPQGGTGSSAGTSAVGPAGNTAEAEQGLGKREGD